MRGARLRMFGRRFMLARYLLASIAALAVDMMLFLAASRGGVPPVASAFAGYVAGLFVHWCISIRFVFHQAGEPVAATHAQRAGFVASALLGLALTMGIVGIATMAGATPALAKGIAIPFNFFAVYAVRKYGVFARR